MSDSIDYLWWAIRTDKTGPNFGPVVDEAEARAAAEALTCPAYVIGVYVDAIAFVGFPDTPDGV